MKRTAHLYQLHLNMAYLTIIIITNNICPTIRVNTNTPLDVIYNKGRCGSSISKMQLQTIEFLCDVNV